MQLSIALSALCFVVILVATSSTFAEADDIIMPNGIDHTDLDRLYDPRRKRPFCNAFTGCGKKRSDESMATLVELNSEPAVDELNRQILSEAKLWEAIQEARGELLRRHHEKAQQSSQQLPSLPLPLAAFRRRRSTAYAPSIVPRRNQIGEESLGRYY